MNYKMIYQCKDRRFAEIHKFISPKSAEIHKFISIKSAEIHKFDDFSHPNTFSLPPMPTHQEIYVSLCRNIKRFSNIEHTFRILKMYVLHLKNIHFTIEGHIIEL